MAWPPAPVGRWGGSPQTLPDGQAAEQTTIAETQIMAARTEGIQMDDTSDVW